MKRKNIECLLSGYFCEDVDKIKSFMGFTKRFHVDWCMLGEAISDDIIDNTLDSAYDYFLNYHFVGVADYVGLLELGYDSVNLSNLIEYKWDVETGKVSAHCGNGWIEIENYEHLEITLTQIKETLLNEEEEEEKERSLTLREAKICENCCFHTKSNGKLYCEYFKMELPSRTTYYCENWIQQRKPIEIRIIL